MLRLDLHLGRPQRLFLGLHHAETLHPGIGPCLDLPDVFLVGAHLHADHDQRQRNGKGAHPVALSFIDELREQLLCNTLDDRVELFDAAGAKSVVEQPTHLLVVRVVAARQRRRRHPTLFLVQGVDLLLAFDHFGRRNTRCLALVHEPLGVHHNGAHIVVTRDHVHARPRVEPHGCFVAQRLVGVVRTVVRCGIKEIDVNSVVVFCGAHFSSPS